LLAFLHAGRNSGRLALKVAGRTVAVGIVGMAMLFESYEESAVAKQLLVRRDHTATVIAFGEGRGKELIVNGFSMTELTPITKVMAHLPLAHLTTLPTSALVIGLGMGTSFRSAMSWGIETKAVELVPSVKEVFGFFHQDGPQLLETGRGQVVIDDGRRFLARTGEQFDVIVIDPPPPVEAAGSSLLYSEEFYALAKKHLREGGILQQWLPGGEERILSAVAGALARSFIYIRVYQDCGFHFLASTRPILPLRAEHLVARMPEAAKHDLLEWNLALTAVEMLGRIVNNEVDIGSLIHLFGPDSEFTITDDRPFNEYFLLRRTTGSAQAAPSFSSQVPCPLSP